MRLRVMIAALVLGVLLFGMTLVPASAALQTVTLTIEGMV